ncbi:MAG: DeoR/GlpR family DNA-binding transcription regulator [Geminicoccaceae bacterium]
MLSQERKSYLLSILQRTGRIVAKDAADDLRLSEDTIRRDLRELAKDGKLKRVHGGAVPMAPANAPFSRRLAIATPEKTAIGRRAAGMIRPGQVAFIDGGTTALQLAGHLPPDLDATIITHSPNVAMELAEHARVDIELVGGRLFRHSIVTCGAATLAWLDRYRPDICFIGATGIHTEMGITTGNSEEAEVKRAIIALSGTAVLLASPEKLGSVSPFELARWPDIDCLVVSAGSLSTANRMFSHLGCEILSAGEA